MPGILTVSIEESAFKISRLSDHHILVDGLDYEFDIVSLDARRFSLILDGKAYIVEDRLRTSPDEASRTGELGKSIELTIRGKSYLVRVDDEHSLLVQSFFGKPSEALGIQIVNAPMPGLISRIETQIGDEVPAGKGLLVLEAMKMENEIRSTRPGRVKAIHVEAGSAVEKGEPLVTITEL